MPEEKQGDTFRVVDRRLFTPEGELRKEALEEERRQEQKTGKAADPARPAATRLEQQVHAPAKESAPAQGATSPVAAADSSRGFEMLVDLLARNATALLGGLPDPSTGKAFLDLEGAREIIEILDALRERTRGNLAPQEEQLLLDVIGSLKLSFMEISKAAADALRGKAKGKS